MDILFKTAKLRELCNDDTLAKRRFGAECARALRKRLDDLCDAPTLADMRALPGKCEELGKDLKGCLSVRLHGGQRLIFHPANDPTPRRSDGGLDWALVTKITVLDVKNYHD